MITHYLTFCFIKYIIYNQLYLYIYKYNMNLEKTSKLSPETLMNAIHQS